MSSPVNRQEASPPTPRRPNASSHRFSQDFLDSLNATLADAASASPQGSPATLRPRRAVVLEDVPSEESKSPKRTLLQQVRRSRASTVSADSTSRKEALEAIEKQYTEYSGTGTLRGARTTWRGDASAERGSLKFAKTERALPRDLLKRTKHPEKKQINPVEAQEAQLQLSKVVCEWEDQEQKALQKLQTVTDWVQDRRSFALLVLHVCKTDKEPSETSVDELMNYLNAVEGVSSFASKRPWVQYLESMAEGGAADARSANEARAKLEEYVSQLAQLLSSFYPLEKRLLSIAPSAINIPEADNFQNLIAPSYQWIGRAKDLLTSYIKNLSKVHGDQHRSVCDLKRLLEFTEHKMSEVAKGNADSLSKERDEARATIERVGKMFTERDVQVNEDYVSNPDHRTENYGYDLELESMKANYPKFQSSTLKTIGELHELLEFAGFKNYSGTWKYPRLPKICVKLPEKPRQELESLSIDTHLVNVLTAIAQVYKAWEECLQ